MKILSPFTNLTSDLSSLTLWGPSEWRSSGNTQRNMHSAPGREATGAPGPGWGRPGTGWALCKPLPPPETLPPFGECEFVFYVSLKWNDCVLTPYSGHFICIPFI